MASDQQQILFCPNCGASIEPGQQFCDQCGARLADYVPEKGPVKSAVLAAEPKKAVVESTTKIEQAKSPDPTEQSESVIATESGVEEASSNSEPKDENVLIRDENLVSEIDTPETVGSDNIRPKKSITKSAETKSTVDRSASQSVAESAPVSVEASSPDTNPSDVGVSAHEKRFSFLSLFSYVFGLGCWFINLWGIVGGLAIIFGVWALVTKIHRLSKAMAVMGIMGGAVNVVYAVAVLVTGGMTL